MMVLLAMASSAQGSYTADFNTAIDTSDPAFRVAPGWSHLVSTGSYTSQKVTYTYVATGGIDGSGCLQAGAQSYFDWWENADVALNDLLITPAVSGTVTLQAMKATSGDNCSVRFFNMSKDDNGNWVMGTEIAYDDPGLLSIDYTEIELTGIAEGTVIGIRAENVYIDDFTATSANVVLQRGLTITSLTPAVAEQNIDCDENNQFEVKATVKVKNTGEVDLNPGDEERFECHDSCLVYEIKDELNRITSAENAKHLFGTDIIRLLIEMGYVENRQIDGKTWQVQTEAGLSRGIGTVEKISKNGNPYKALVYPPEVQREIVAHYIRDGAKTEP